MIDLLAGQPQYEAHIRPIWDRLPDELKGRVIRPTDSTAGLAPFVMVAGGIDSKRARRSRAIWVEHGAGQSYGGIPSMARHVSYVGGMGHDHVGLFLAPGEAACARWRRFYPKARVEAVGCPKLDEAIKRGIPATRSHRTVAMTWHWDCRTLPETRSALPEYNEALPALVAELKAQGVEVLGHAHPRWGKRLVDRYAVLGVEHVASLDEVFERAGLLIVDNSSAGFEAAALGLNTVWLNASYYRRTVNHGLRFWGPLPGPTVDTPAELWRAVEFMLDPAGARSWESTRQGVVSRVYAYTDGSSTDRALNAVLDLVLN